MKIDLEKQFQFYLDLVKLNRETISEVQLTETKRAFYGGLGQMFKLFLEVAELPEENCDAIFTNIEEQITNFWIIETIKSEP